MADWYYIGHYGQLGPLTRDQIDELIQGGVIMRETYVWHAGMPDWMPADRVNELSDCFRLAQPFGAPPPPPSPHAATGAPPTFAEAASPYGSDYYSNPPSTGIYGYGGGSYLPVASDRSRVAAGVLQLLIPGVGRMYLGYAAIGVLQLVLLFCGIGWIWSVVDGILILAGSPKVDGYGRVLSP